MKAETIHQVAAELDMLAGISSFRERDVLHQGAAMIRALWKRYSTMKMQGDEMAVLAEAQELIEAEGEPPLCNQCHSGYMAMIAPGVITCRHCAHQEVIG